MRTTLVIATSFLVLLLIAPMVWAHGATSERIEADAVTLRFDYGIGEPMADTDVVLSSPGGEVWQRGRTDRTGRYSFVPDTPGEWVAVADDGQGHETRARVEIGAEAGAPEAGASPTRIRLPPGLLVGLLVVSLIGNALLLARLTSGVARPAI